jgi:hypothetical protein
MKCERYHSVKQVQAQFFPGRSVRWVRATFCDGELGPVIRDAGGWLISETAVSEYQRRHQVGLNVIPLRKHQLQNLRNQKA